MVRHLGSRESSRDDSVLSWRGPLVPATRRAASLISVARSRDRLANSTLHAIAKRSSVLKHSCNSNKDSPVASGHSHVHRHDPMEHDHDHAPDVHHNHGH
jgi:hypothetical protein